MNGDLKVVLGRALKVLVLVAGKRKLLAVTVFRLLAHLAGRFSDPALNNMGRVRNHRRDSNSAGIYTNGVIR